MYKAIGVINSALAQQVIKGLESRNMTGYYAETREEALKTALSLIPEGSTITSGCSMSLMEIGLLDAISSGNYTFLNPREAQDKHAAFVEAYGSDIFLSSCNAMTDDGILVNIDGNSNRISCIAYGPEKVILVVSMKKVCSDLDSAMKRARNKIAPIIAARQKTSAPCTRTGKCYNCKVPDTVCCQFMVTRFSRIPGRIHVILVGEDIGF